MSIEKTNYLALEKLVQSITGALIDLFTSQGMTTKRLAALSQIVFVNKLKEQGCSQQEIIHYSGLSKKTVMKYLRQPLLDERFNGLDSFLENWRKNPNFPMQLSLDREAAMPNWHDLCEEYKPEFTSKFILDYLLQSQCVKVEDEQVLYLTNQVNFSGLNKETINYVAFSVENLLNTINHNVLTNKPKLFERNFWCPKVDPGKEKLFVDFMTEKLRQVGEELSDFVEENNIELQEEPANCIDVGCVLAIWRRSSHDEKNNDN